MAAARRKPVGNSSWRQYASSRRADGHEGNASGTLHTNDQPTVPRRNAMFDDTRCCISNLISGRC